MKTKFTETELEAIANANAYMNNTTLPNWSELLEEISRLKKDRETMLKVLNRIKQMPQGYMYEEVRRAAITTIRFIERKE